MLIKISDSEVLDTRQNIKLPLEECKKFDEDQTGKMIIFNIRFETGEKMCEVAKAGTPIKSNIRYIDIMEKLAEHPEVQYCEYNLYGDALVFLLALRRLKNLNHKLDGMSTEANNITIDNYSLSEEEQAKNRATNLRQFGPVKDRIMVRSDFYDIDQSDPKILTAQNLILKAKSILKAKKPFYWIVLRNLKEVYMPEDVAIAHRCETMGVDSSYIYFNVEFALTLNIRQVVFILAHEASHVTLGHEARLRSRNHHIWNIAGDLIINKTLCEQEFNITPDHPSDLAEFSLGIYSDDVDLSVDTTDSIYEEIYTEYINNAFAAPPPPIPFEGQPPQMPQGPTDIDSQIIDIVGKIRGLADQPVNADVRDKVLSRLQNVTDSLTVAKKGK